MKAEKAVLFATLLVCVACQNTEQSSVQPEKLASSSASGAAAPGSNAPFAPFASGFGPNDMAPKPDGSALAENDPDAPEFNPDGPSVKPAPSKASQPAVSKRKPGVVKLIKAGAEPQKKLRFTPKVGDKRSVEMVMKTEISMEIDGKKPPTGTVPPIVFIMDTKVVKVSDAGEIEYTFKVIEAGVRAMPGVQAQVITALNQALGGLIGLSGSVTVTNRGITKQTKLALAGKTNAQTQQVLAGMEQAMQQLGAPLPEEAVGKGAQWTYTTTMKQNGINLTQVATYDLVKISGDKLTCKVALTQSAPKQKVASPVGVTVDLISLKSKGKGTTKIHLDRLTPIKSKMKVDTKAKMGLPQGQTMKMDSALTIEMSKPKKQKAKKKSKSKASAPPAPKPAPKPAAPSGP